MVRLLRRGKHPHPVQKLKYTGNKRMENEPSNFCASHEVLLQGNTRMLILN